MSLWLLLKYTSFCRLKAAFNLSIKVASDKLSQSLRLLLKHHMSTVLDFEKLTAGLKSTLDELFSSAFRLDKVLITEGHSHRHSLAFQPGQYIKLAIPRWLLYQHLYHIDRTGHAHAHSQKCSNLISIGLRCTTFCD